MLKRSTSWSMLFQGYTSDFLALSFTSFHPRWNQSYCTCIISLSPLYMRKLRLAVLLGPWSDIEQRDGKSLSTKEAGISGLGNSSPGPAMYHAPFQKILTSPCWSGLAKSSAGVLKSMMLQPAAHKRACERHLSSEYPSKVPSFEALASSMKES